MANILRYTQISNANVTIELPTGITLAYQTESPTIELGDIYPAVRSGFGYPMTFYWHLKATQEGNYTIKVTVKGENIAPVIKFFYIEVKNSTIDVFMENSELYLTPNESFSWKVGVKLRGNERKENVKIWLYFPFSDWYAPHQEITIDNMEAGEYKEVIFNFTEWYQRAPIWSIPGEKITIVCTSLVNGFVGEDTYVFINVVPSKLRLTADNEVELQSGEKAEINIQLQALGIQPSKDIKLELTLTSGIEVENETTILLGTLFPSENLSVHIIIKGIIAGTFYLKIYVSSSNAYGDELTVVLRVSTTKGNNIIILATSLAFVVGIIVTAATMLFSPRILKLLKISKK